MKLIIVLLGLMGFYAQADYLDPPYEVFNPPINLEANISSAESVSAMNVVVRSSDTLATILKQSPVKAQGSRGTCSIFSATAYLEHHLAENEDFDTSVDLSEEWLEYLIMRQRGKEGSFSGSNFNALLTYGSPAESVWPYLGETWKSLDSPLAKARCSAYESDQYSLDRCLLGHKSPWLLEKSNSELNDPRNSYYDPEFSLARNEAAFLKEDYLFPKSYDYRLNYVSQIKNELKRKDPVILDIDFYYGAWNHRKATDMGIGRDMSHWAAGIVGYPEIGSVDVKKSLESRAGHSVLLVGYDEDKVVTKTILMENGQYKTFTYRGVYYFKNSWGTDGFGASFNMDNQSFPGYGMIVMDYAHNYGSFYRIQF